MSEIVKRTRKTKSAEPPVLSIPSSLPASNTLEFKVEKPKGRKKTEVVSVPAEIPAKQEEQLLLTPKIKTKRLPSKYNLFVKEHMQTDEVKKLASKERFAHISKLYKDSKV